jgi:hypothetical protein
MKRKIALIVFCLLYGGVSIFIIIQSVRNYRDRKTTFTVQKINVPKNIGRSRDSLRVLENFYQSHFKK